MFIVIGLIIVYILGIYLGGNWVRKIEAWREVNEGGRKFILNKSIFDINSWYWWKYQVMMVGDTKNINLKHVWNYFLDENMEAKIEEFEQLEFFPQILELWNFDTSIKWRVRVKYMYWTPTLVEHVSVKCPIQKTFVRFLTILAWS